jgi:hypothetical protein
MMPATIYNDRIENLVSICPLKDYERYLGLGTYEEPLLACDVQQDTVQKSPYKSSNDYYYGKSFTLQKGKLI